MKRLLSSNSHSLSIESLEILLGVCSHFMSFAKFTLKVLITTTADDILKYVFVSFQENKTFHVNCLPSR